ncbi:MAG: hypothetical protein ABSA74_03550 [Candidatus Staskawiczbacteria bacterium]|jgi:hypothetical protein
MLSEAALQEFKKIWFEEFGEEISDEKAAELGINLLTFFDKIHRPVKKNWWQELLKKEGQENKK